MGGSSRSSTVTDQSTDISTITETNIGSIGISGSEVAEILAVAGQGTALQVSEIRRAVESQASSQFQLAKMEKEGGFVTQGINPTFIAAGVAAILAVMVMSK